MDTFHASPRESIHVEQLAKELGHISQLVGLEAVNSCILILESLVEDTHPCLVEEAQPLP